MGEANGWVFQRTGLTSVDPYDDPEEPLITPWQTDAEAKDACDEWMALLNQIWAERWDGDHFGDVFLHKDSPNPYRGCVYNFDLLEVPAPAGAMFQVVRDTIWLNAPAVAADQPAPAARPTHDVDPALTSPLGTTISGRKAAAMMRKTSGGKKKH